MFSSVCAKAGRAAIFWLIAGLGIGGAIWLGLGKAALQVLASSAEWRGRFVRDLPGSDGLHCGNGTIMVNANKI